MENAWPPTRIAPLRGAHAFRPTVKLTESFPVLLPALVIVTHSSDAAGVQLQPSVPSTVKLPLPPSACTFWLFGRRSNWQVSPSCTTSNTWLPTTTVPFRDSEVVFAATTYSTPPSPWPLAGCLAVIQGTLLVIDH